MSKAIPKNHRSKSAPQQPLAPEIDALLNDTPSIPEQKLYTPPPLPASPPDIEGHSAEPIVEVPQIAQQLRTPSPKQEIPPEIVILLDEIYTKQHKIITEFLLKSPVFECIMEEPRINYEAFKTKKALTKTDRALGKFKNLTDIFWICDMRCVLTAMKVGKMLKRS